MSLTPQEHNQRISSEAMQEGLISGAFVVVPSLGALYVAMQNTTFVARTNWQARTAMVVMPALFAFSLTAEKYVEHRMKEMAEENAEKQIKNPNPSSTLVRTGHQNHLHRMDAIQNLADKELHLMTMDRDQARYTVVPGDKLGIHHRAANFVAANPIKVLAGLAVPSVALIFYGRTGKEHLQMSMKLLHTRVFGQFTTISLMLGIMGFKDYMDSQGSFITEVEASRRADEMQQIRSSLLERLEEEEHIKEDEERELKALHDANVSAKKVARKHKSQHHTTIVQ